jgi:hypothetical protein
VTQLTEPAVQTAIAAACRTLGLPAIRAGHGRIADAAARERLTTPDSLAVLLTAECDERDARRRLRLINEARFPGVQAARGLRPDRAAHPAGDSIRISHAMAGKGLVAMNSPAAGLVATAGQILWPPPGRSHDRHWAPPDFP